MSSRALAGAILALVGIGSATAAETVAIVTGPGDQSAPSLSGTRLAYLDESSGKGQVVVRDLGGGAVVQISSGAVEHGAPDLEGTTVVFAAPDGVHVVSLEGGGEVLVPAAGAARVVLSGGVTAWEQAGTGGRDVAVLSPGATVPLVIPGAGDEHAPSTSFGWVAWLDESGDGAIRLRGAGGAVTTPWAGRAAKVSLWAASRLATPLLAVAVAGAGGDQDLVVLDAGGAERARLALPGNQQNPTLSGEWVGFEDLATGVPQVAVWQWSTGRVVYPSPSTGPQLLNDLAVDGDALRLAWADGRGGDLDLYLFSATLPLPDVPPGQARCDDPLAPVVADLAITAGPEGFGAGALAFAVADDSPALVCLDTVRAVAAWAQVAGTTIELPYLPGTGPGPAGPRDDDHGHWHHDHGRDHGGGHFDRGRHRGTRHHGDGDACEPVEPLPRHAEARLTLPAGPVAAAGFVTGWPGATLRVRVLADGWKAPARTGCLAGVDCPVAAAAGEPIPATGCSSGGAAGLLAFLLGPALLAARLRRRRA